MILCGLLKRVRKNTTGHRTDESKDDLMTLSYYDVIILCLRGNANIIEPYFIIKSFERMIGIVIIFNFIR